MRISDWSSDVCSSDLIEEVDREDRLLRGFVAYAGIDVDPRGDLCLELRIAVVSPQLCVERRSAVLRRGFEQRDVVKLARCVGEQLVGTKQIGIAWCRERVCQTVSIQVVALSFIKKTHIKRQTH